jgi:hypothetical protein
VHGLHPADTYRPLLETVVAALAAVCSAPKVAALAVVARAAEAGRSGGGRRCGLGSPNVDVRPPVSALAGRAPAVALESGPQVAEAAEDLVGERILLRQAVER